MRTKRFDFNFRPLLLSTSLSVEGSVPGRQVYDSDSGEYTPDYTMTPLVIQPRVGRMDKDGIVQSGSVNKDLFNIRWREIIGGVATLINVDNTNYEIVTSGDNAGRIRVKKNAEPSLPITLEFTAEYLDAGRTRQVIAVRGTYMIASSNSSKSPLVFELTAADTTVYNPLKDTSVQTVHAYLRAGADQVPGSNWLPVWEILREGGVWEEVGDEDYCINTAGNILVINRSLMGYGVSLRVRAKYDAGGNPGSTPLTDTSPAKIINFVRRIPRYEYDITGLPTSIPPSLMYVYPEVIISDTNGIMDNATDELLPLWYIATNSTGGLYYSLVATGKTPEVSTGPLDDVLGAVLAVDVIDRGPLLPMEDSDGKILADSDGKILLIK